VPANIAFGLFPALGERIRHRRERNRRLAERALADLAAFGETLDLPGGPPAPAAVPAGGGGAVERGNG
jgi:hypothetical protein